MAPTISSTWGVIALIRRDFERLAELMDEARKAREEAREQAKAAGSEVGAARNAEADGEGQPPEDLPQIDRVIFYIDEPDRCPAERVVEVLEAVHLLLALKLFVVVVGVDSRWLVRSLQRHYQAQLSPDEVTVPQRQDDWVYWDTTPQNYLEKIFQIVFSIRSMGRTGYESLLDTLFPNMGSASIDARRQLGASAGRRRGQRRRSCRLQPRPGPNWPMGAGKSGRTNLRRPPGPLRAIGPSRGDPTDVCRLQDGCRSATADAEPRALVPPDEAAIGGRGVSAADTDSLTTAQAMKSEEQGNTGGGHAVQKPAAGAVDNPATGGTSEHDPGTQFHEDARSFRSYPEVGQATRQHLSSYAGAGHCRRGRVVPPRT